MKTLVYDTLVNNTEELITKIALAAVESQDILGVIQNVWIFMRRKCEAFILIGGGNFEH